MSDAILNSAGRIAETAPVVSEIAWFALIACACRYLKNRQAAVILAAGVASFIIGWVTRLFVECKLLSVTVGALSDLAIGCSFMLMMVSIAYLVKVGWNRAHALKHEAETDGLTGVYNRRYFLRTLENIAADTKKEFAIAIIDIDNMKEINDNFGHHKGDEALQRVAKAIREGIRQTDIVARLGGDEFGIIFTNTSGDPQVLLQRLRKQLDTSSVAASFGLACYPKDANDVENLIAVADARMYRQKKTRKRRAGQNQEGVSKGTVLFPAARLAE
ncbi:MAG: GGDEF domain-containing protein [Bacillota bacterium]